MLRAERGLPSAFSKACGMGQAGRSRKRVLWGPQLEQWKRGRRAKHVVGEPARKAARLA